MSQLPAVTEHMFAGFTETAHARVRRDSDSYRATELYVINNITRVVEQYADAPDAQTQRLMRDDIDRHLRRFHQYCVQQRWGAHYRDRELTGPGIFEHMIPNSTVRDLLLQGRITAAQACHMPTCQLSESRDRALRQQGWGSRTPDCYRFWQRYRLCFDTENLFETALGHTVDTEQWTLADHFEHFEDWHEVDTETDRSYTSDNS